MDVPECPRCRVLLARNAELEARVLALEGQLRDLLDKLKPPTAKAATPQPPAPAKNPTGKRPGGQPGHPPAMKALVPAERVNHVVPYIPERCNKCDKPLPQEAGDGAHGDARVATGLGPQGHQRRRYGHREDPLQRIRYGRRVRLHDVARRTGHETRIFWTPPKRGRSA